MWVNTGYVAKQRYLPLGFCVKTAYYAKIKKAKIMAQWSANINVMMKVIRRAARGLLRDFNEVEKTAIHPPKARPISPIRRRHGPVNICKRHCLKPVKPTVIPTVCKILRGLIRRGGGLSRPWMGVVKFHPLLLPFWAISVALEHRGGGGCIGDLQSYQ